MKPMISLITIWTNNIEEMKAFYSTILGFEVINDLGNYVAFKNEGVRFAICMREVMYDYSDAFKVPCRGQNFELAFPCDSPEDVDTSYQALLNKGVKGIKAPHDMPWQQRTALFSDPDGNIHEIFANL